jgi:CHAT domain-containing protein
MAGIPIEALTDRYQVSYAPSATMYAWLQGQRKVFPPQTGSLLALGDPVFSEEQAKGASQGKDDPIKVAARGANLKALPGTRGEVLAIGQLFTAQGAKVEKLLGADARAQNLERLARTKELKQFHYLHLATHGFADPQGGMNSFLALTSDDFAVASYAKLSAGQIMRTWELDADLVTLSACQTGLGEQLGGEGYVGFAQALFLAGSHSLVLSQWPVDDRATALLMQRLYQNVLGARPGLKGPLPKLEALAEAKQWLRELSRKEALVRLRAYPKNPSGL